MFDLYQSRWHLTRLQFLAAVPALLLGAAAIAAFVTDHQRLSGVFFLAFDVAFICALYVRYRKPR
jgi:hypothetical protein